MRRQGPHLKYFVHTFWYSASEWFAAWSEHSEAVGQNPPCAGLARGLSQDTLLDAANAATRPVGAVMMPVMLVQSTAIWA